MWFDWNDERLRFPDTSGLQKSADLTNDPRVRSYSRAVPGRINHRGWIVLTSASSSDGSLCVDIFRDPAGGFGFEHFRSEPEDGGRWTAIGGFGGSRFSTRSEAAAAAEVSVFWLKQDPRARASLAAWLTRPEV